jgi:hypothetical protein
VLRSFVICVALVVCACKDSEVAKLGEIRDDVCACKTSRCGEEALARVPKRDVEASPRAQQIAREMMNCLAALYAKERPTQDPDADVSGPGSSAPASAGTP